MSSESEKTLEHDKSNFLTGTVVAVQANYYWVRLAATEDQPILLCTRRSLLKKIGQRVIVGDRVQVEEPDWAEKRGVISQVLPRRSILDRPPIANADQILLVFALAEPTIEPYQLSRFLVKAESTELEVCLCLSKSDLATSEVKDYWWKQLSGWGYEPIFISVKNEIGLSEINYRLSQKVTVVSGPSGVGKSSLINQLIPTVEIRVGAVSGKLAKGRHTTRHVELFELPLGGLLADTPGFNQPDVDYVPKELAQYFPEIRGKLAIDRCQFNDCLHRDEPGCVVRGDWERYEHYLDFLGEAIDHQTQMSQQSDPDAVMKLKTKGKGEAKYEPRLDTKKYRQESRRMRQQSLQSLKNDIENLMKSDED
ncbi:MAG: small ribosomal subunit biogenesis GTPase RsgA [Leptolyngbyaceae cyanobacterium CSU_1_3]|nr:small ribosomal subunit biogenesis GTPase RsgA [Leptolyngbyaceae cyanobacterium CSU_1_3]